MIDQPHGAFLHRQLALSEEVDTLARGLEEAMADLGSAIHIESR